MTNQNTILRVLPAPDGEPAGLDAISQAVCGKTAPPGSPKRRQIIKRLGTLQSRGLISVVTPPRSFGEPSKVGYRLTAEGVAFRASGATIKSGPRGRHTGVKTHRQDTLCARVWKALRYMQKATVSELIEVAGAPGNIKTAATNVHRYLRKLEAVKVTKRLSLRAQGASPTSNGEVRYMLVRDLGAQAPVAGKYFVFDPNANERIDYPAPPAERVA